MEIRLLQRVNPQRNKWLRMVHDLAHCTHASAIFAIKPMRGESDKPFTGVLKDKSCNLDTQTDAVHMAEKRQQNLWPRPSDSNCLALSESLGCFKFNQ